MPLIDIWASNPAAVTSLSIEQVVATAGDGKRRDESPCSVELRQYLTQVSSDRLAVYARHCLTDSFPKSGVVLQDVVNELGRRLDYTVTNGRYQGVTGAIGFDGIWRGPGGTDLVVEVKTTDAYRIPLNTIATYRDKLREAGDVGRNASVLVVVGREDTGELEAQVRGSRHAWDFRLISVDALLKLVELKESTEAGLTGAKLRSVLAPVEYTRLDGLVDLMFTAAKDVEAAVEAENPEASEASGWEFTDPKLLQTRRDAILASLSARDGVKLIKHGRALYWDADHMYRAVCTLSKRYTKKGQPPLLVCIPSCLGCVSGWWVHWDDGLGVHRS